MTERLGITACFSGREKLMKNSFFRVKKKLCFLRFSAVTFCWPPIETLSYFSRWYWKLQAVVVAAAVSFLSFSPAIPFLPYTTTPPLPSLRHHFVQIFSKKIMLHIGVTVAQRIEEYGHSLFWWIENIADFLNGIAPVFRSSSFGKFEIFLPFLMMNVSGLSYESRYKLMQKEWKCLFR